MKSMEINKTIISLCLVAVFAGSLYAPLKSKDINTLFYDNLIGSKWQKYRALQGFKKWPAMFGHTQKEIFRKCKKESSFRIKATSHAGAEGLMQPTILGVRGLPDAERFLVRAKNDNGGWEWALNKKVYDPYWNIYIGCKIYDRCKQIAKPYTIGRFHFTKREVADFYYVTGYGNFHKRIIVSLNYIQ